MKAEPIIVILDDERPQIVALRATLDKYGEVHAFYDPEPALQFIRSRRVDLAIIDVHLPRMAMNGVELARAVREFDKDLSLIFRTGDNSPELADDAIAIHAFRRAVKSKTNVQEMREMAVAAIQETRNRRIMSRDASSVVGISKQLQETLGSIEDELSVAEGYRGLLHSLRNQLTAAAGYAETWMAITPAQNTSVEHATGNKKVIAKMLAEMNAFLDGPFAEMQTPRKGCVQADVNATLEALRKRFMAATIWAPEGKSIEIIGLSQPLLVVAHPVRLLTALRHATEFCLALAQTGARVTLKARGTSSVEQFIDELGVPNLVFNRPVREHPAGYVGFALHSGSVDYSLEEIRNRFHSYPTDPRIGNLHMLGLSLGNDRCTLVAHFNKPGHFFFHLFIPVG